MKRKQGLGARISKMGFKETTMLHIISATKELSDRALSYLSKWLLSMHNELPEGGLAHRSFLLSPLPAIIHSLMSTPY